MPTITIDNFNANLTRFEEGNMTSGLAKYSSTYGADPFSNPTNLRWFEQPTQIDPNGSVITDLIVAAKNNLESGIVYVYAIGHTGRLYKIQVNNPSTYNPDYDNPVLLTTLSSNSPKFTMGGSIDFYGGYIFIGHDIGVTQINFDGTGETFLGSAGSYTANVPRPLKQFVGKIYFGNGNNIGEIDSTLTITTYSKLSPAFPSGTQVRDLDLSIDGNYMEMVVNRTALSDITSPAPDTSNTINGDSYIILWNGTDTGSTSSTTFPSYSLTANVVFGTNQYTFGYDLTGTVVYNGEQKILSPTFTNAPLPSAANSNGNLVFWLSSEYDSDSSTLMLSHFTYGPLDEEYPQKSWYRQFKLAASGSQTDIIRSPMSILVSNVNFGASNSNYPLNKISSGKLYFSTLETSSSTTAYKFYKFDLVPLGLNPAIAGVYETQSTIFPSKVSVKEVRIYTDPMVSSAGMYVALTGAEGVIIPNSDKTFVAGTNFSVGDEMLRYSPSMNQSYVIAFRVANTGTANFTIRKVEIDYEEVRS